MPQCRRHSETMNTEKKDRTAVYTTTEGSHGVAIDQDGEQVQLSFFDAEAVTEKMNTTIDGVVPESVQTPVLVQTAQVDPMPTVATDVFAESDHVEFEPAESDLAGSGPAESEPVAKAESAVQVDDVCLGQRLRAAREARGMSCEDAARQLRLPVIVVQALEAEHYERIGQGVYLRGYLNKYLHLLQLPQVLAERVAQHLEVPPLVTSGTISRPRYLFDRYSISALYLILTGVIIVPAVWLAMNTGFDHNLARIAPLDAPEFSAPAITSAVSDKTITPNGIPSTNAEPATVQQPSAPVSVTPPAANDEAPLIASMTPFPTTKPAPGDAVDSGTKATILAPLAAGEHRLHLSLTEPSWVEIVAADGEKLEYGLLPAGSVRDYTSIKTLDVRLGNCTGASVEIDGNVQDLTSYRHANVAHFELASGQSTISRSGG